MASRWKLFVSHILCAVWITLYLLGCHGLGHSMNQKEGINRPTGKKDKESIRDKGPDVEKTTVDLSGLQISSKNSKKTKDETDHKNKTKILQPGNSSDRRTRLSTYLLSKQ